MLAPNAISSTPHTALIAFVRSRRNANAPLSLSTSSAETTIGTPNPAEYAASFKPPVRAPPSLAASSRAAARNAPTHGERQSEKTMPKRKADTTPRTSTLRARPSVGSRNSPMKPSPSSTTSTPQTISTARRCAERALPSVPAATPSATNTRVKPATNASARAAVRTLPASPAAK